MRTLCPPNRKISWTGGNPPHFENSFEGPITDQGDTEGNWHTGEIPYLPGLPTHAIRDVMNSV
jgi:hypothetical protein